jgi:hypothetical protein
MSEQPSEQRIDHGAAAAAGPDSDVGEGQGLANDSAHQHAGDRDTGDLPIAGDDRDDTTVPADGDTEGEQVLRRNGE